MESVLLKITEWSSAKSWTTDIAHTKSMLTDLVRKSTPMSHTEAKRLIRAVFAQQATELLLVNAEFFNPIRSALQSVGAQVEVHPAQQRIQADGQRPPFNLSVSHMKNSHAFVFVICVFLPCLGITASDAERSQSQKNWAMALVKKVRVNWHRPENSSDTFACKVRLNLKPNGELISYNFVQSCGSAELDTSVVRAIIKSEPLPLPSISDAFVPELTFSFRP